mmetsp:Transcript_63848/g.106163  ORF Transcript_63848/g.106163 Transcript_63848/m.106163 type:complete len:132 (-) Transcript_63848:193-588(-)
MPGFSRLVAEKNLLKITQSNKYVSLQVVNNRSGHIFLAASSMERDLREQLRADGGSTSDRTAARAVATRLCERARERNVTAITWERNTLRYIGKVKTIIDTLREHGLRFVAHAHRAERPSVAYLPSRPTSS